jgi:divalent metal cation (Fe/Co/Zn/Cd) transporter
MIIDQRHRVIKRITLTGAIVNCLLATSKAFAELIDTGLDIKLVGRVKSLIEANGCVREVHSLRSRSMGGPGYVDAEIRVNPRLTVSEAHYIAFHLSRRSN